MRCAGTRDCISYPGCDFARACLRIVERRVYKMPIVRAVIEKGPANHHPLNERWVAELFADAALGLRNSSRSFIRLTFQRYCDERDASLRREVANSDPVLFREAS